jgi:hypothetical protein
VIAECRLVLLLPQPPQPRGNVHATLPMLRSRAGVCLTPNHTARDSPAEAPSPGVARLVSAAAEVLPLSFANRRTAVSVASSLTWSSNASSPARPESTISTPCLPGRENPHEPDPVRPMPQPDYASLLRLLCLWGHDRYNGLKGACRLGN